MGLGCYWRLQYAHKHTSTHTGVMGPIKQRQLQDANEKAPAARGNELTNPWLGGGDAAAPPGAAAAVGGASRDGRRPADVGWPYRRRDDRDGGVNNPRSPADVDGVEPGRLPTLGSAGRLLGAAVPSLGAGAEPPPGEVPPAAASGASIAARQVGRLHRQSRREREGGERVRERERESGREGGKKTKDTRESLCQCFGADVNGCFGAVFEKVTGKNFEVRSTHKQSERRGKECSGDMDPNFNVNATAHTPTASQTQTQNNAVNTAFSQI